MARGNLLLFLVLPVVLARYVTKTVRIAPEEQESEHTVVPKEYGVGFSVTGDSLSIHDDFRLGRAATKLVMLPGLQTLAAWTKDGQGCVLRGSTFAHESSDDNQWFRQFQVEVNGVNVLEVDRPFAYDSMQVRLDGEAQNAPSGGDMSEAVENTSANGAVTLKRSDQSEWTGKNPVETLHATACGASMRIDSSLALNFESFKKQADNVHLNLHMEKLPAGATGLLAELKDEKPLSAASRGSMRIETQQAAITKPASEKSADIPAAVSYALANGKVSKALPTEEEMRAAAKQRVADAHEWTKARDNAIQGVTAISKSKTEDEAQDWFKARDAVLEQAAKAKAAAKDSVLEQTEAQKARQQARQQDRLQTKLHREAAPPATTAPEAAAPVAVPLPAAAPAAAPLPEVASAAAPVAELVTPLVAAAELADAKSCVAVSGAAVDDKWCQQSCNHNPPMCPESMCTCAEGAMPSPAAVAQAAADEPAAAEAGADNVQAGADEPTKVAELRETRSVTSDEVDETPTAESPSHDETGGCKDDQLECSGWAAKGQCESNPGFMMTSCAFSCTRCNEGPQFATELRSMSERMKLMHMRQRDARLCADDDAACMARAIEAAAAGPSKPAHPSKLSDSGLGNDTTVAFRYVTATACRDERVECTGWAASSECETNSAYMLTSCAFSCTKCNEGLPHQLRSKAERKSIWYQKRHPHAQTKKLASPSPSPVPKPSPSPKPLASPEPSFVDKLEDKFKPSSNKFGFEVHLLACSRNIDNLLHQLSAATCSSQERQELFIHIDRCGNEHNCVQQAKLVYKAAHNYQWPCGPTTVRHAPTRRGMREMYFDALDLVHARYLRYGEAAVLMLEDDMSVSPVYATYLEVAMGMVRNESFIVGASLSPLRMNDMVEPAQRWHGSSALRGEQMYLSAVPSGPGGAYWNTMIGPFMRYLRLRMTYHDYAKEERLDGQSNDAPKRLQPTALEVPNVQSNFWAHSWRKHMVEFMYGNGYVMAYPNLPEEKGYATSLFLDAPARPGLGSKDGSADLRVAKIQRSMVAFKPAWREWPVLDLQMHRTSLHALAMLSVDYMDSKHPDWTPLIEYWAQPQCLLDRAYTAHKSERPRALMYQPQSGVDSQLSAFQAATTLAAALGRTLIAPRLYSPTVCTSCSRRNMSYYFGMNAVDWSGGSVPVRAVVQTEPDWLAQANTSSAQVLAASRVWSYLAHVPNTALVAVPPKVKLPTLSLLSASNWLQCNDDTLFFDGLEENDLPRSTVPPVSDAVHRAHKAVRGLLKLPKKYMCMNLNSHDSLEACHNRRGTDWFQKLDKAGYQCGTTNADMEEYAAKGTSMLILSSHPVLDFVKKHRKDNPHIFTSYDVEATAHHHGIRDSATISMIEQMMCAGGERAILNMFSASSRRIAELRKERGGVSSWFKKDLKVDKSDPLSTADPDPTEWDVQDEPDAAQWDAQSNSEARAEAEAAAEGSDDPLSEAKARDFIASDDKERELKKKAKKTAEHDEDDDDEPAKKPTAKSVKHAKPSPSPTPKKHKTKIIGETEDEDFDDLDELSAYDNDEYDELDSDLEKEPKKKHTTKIIDDEDIDIEGVNIDEDDKPKTHKVKIIDDEDIDIEGDKIDEDDKPKTPKAKIIDVDDVDEAVDEMARVDDEDDAIVKASPAPKKHKLKPSPSPSPKPIFGPETDDDEADEEEDAEPQLSKMRMTLNPDKTTLVRLDAEEVENFGMPQFHGCRGFYDHCHFENVCFSGHDGMLVPDVPGVNFTAFLDQDALPGMQGVQARLLPLEDFQKLRKVYYTKGSAYALNCAGQSLFNHDPAHYMVGYGKLFVAAHDPTVQRNVDSLIFQQCMQNAPDEWDWGKGVWAILESLGKDSQFWSPEAVDTVTLGAPSNSSAPYGRLPSAHDPVVCAKRVTMERRWGKTYLGGNVAGIVGRWRSRIDWWISKLPKVAKAMKRHAKEAQIEAQEKATLSPLKVVGDCKLLCTKGLRVAVLQRTEEQPALHNVDELGALVSEYTREPLQMLVVNDKMSFDEQVAIFRSFDVLISPPTPLLTNAMFAAKNSVIIEVQSAAYDTMSMQNGKNFVLSFLRSSGHLPVKAASQSSTASAILASHGVSLAALSNASKPNRCALQVDCALTQAMDHCWGQEETCGQHRAKAFNAVELYVDVPRLRTALEEAVALRCSCKSEDLAQRLTQNRTGPCPGTGDCCQTTRALAANDYFYHSCNAAIQEAKTTQRETQEAEREVEQEEKKTQRELRQSVGLEPERFEDRAAAAEQAADGEHFGPNEFMSPTRGNYITQEAMEAKNTKRARKLELAKQQQEATGKHRGAKQQEATGKHHGPNQFMSRQRMANDDAQD
jgi:hypothetical protein